MINRTGSRQDQILSLLLNFRTGMSIDEISEQLEISRNAVKQHLVVLQNENLIKKDTLNNTGGRPSQNYVLTEQGINHFPKQYSWFCNLLLSELKSEMGSQAFEQFMGKLGATLAQSLAPQFANKNSDRKIDALIEIMQSFGYQAARDETEKTPTIKAINCVYHDLAQEHPELCEFDRALMSTLLENPIKQTECMAKRDCSCKFKISHIQKQ